MTNKEMIQEAIKGRDNSYSPYSKFKVGAAIFTKDGKIFYGANIENASYSLCMCAERNAIFNAMNHGYKKEDFIALSIVADTLSPVSPCGSCRQVISELLPRDAKIVLGNLKDEIKVMSIDELLPYAFDERDL